MHCKAAYLGSPLPKNNNADSPNGSGMPSSIVGHACDSTNDELLSMPFIVFSVLSFISILLLLTRIRKQRKCAIAVEKLDDEKD